MSGKFALVIGNTEYTDPGLAQLTAPGKDAEDFARVLKDQEIGAFDQVNILFNQSSSASIEAIDEFFDQKKPDDLLVLYFSGHGVRDELGALYLAVKNTIRTRLRSTAIKSDYIRDVMDQSRSKRQVLILDCCNSGAFSQGTKAATGVSIGTASAFEGGYGRIILTASDSTQFAWEGDKVIGETDNSLFTHYLVEGLEGEADQDGDGRITADELYDYAYEKVRLATPKQTPSKFSSKQQGEIVLRHNMRLEDIKPVPLPDELVNEIEDTRPYVREAAVQKLERLLKSKNIGLARSAAVALEKIADDENTTRRVSQAATQMLETYKQTLQKAEKEHLAKAELEAERPAEEKRRADKRAEAERLAKEKRQIGGKVGVEQKAKILSAHDTAEKVLITPRNIPSPETNIQRQQPILKWVLIGVIGLCILGTGAWGISYIAGLGVATATEAPVPTEEPLIEPSLSEATEEPTFVPTPSGGGNGKIAFSSNRDGNYEIYVMNADGSNQTRLTNNPADDFEPSWSPNGKNIAFYSNRDGNNEIYVMNSDGSDQTRLTDNTAEDFAPVWSPNGDRIAFFSDRDDNYEIYVMNADGSNQIRLTDNPEYDFSPTWSPDGNRIAFVSIIDGNLDIWLMSTDGQGLTRLTNDPAADFSPIWSPDGNRIAFSSDRDGNDEIYVMNTDASELTRLTNNLAGDVATAWSPDGNHIAFQSARDDPSPDTCTSDFSCNYEIYVMNADGSEQTRLTNNAAGDLSPDWSP